MKQLWQKYSKQFIRFGLVGVVNTIVDLIVYTLALKLLGQNILLKSNNYLIAQLLGFIAGTLNAYIMNGSFVFKGEHDERLKGKKQLIRTFIGYSFTFALSEVLLWVWISKAGINEIVSKLINLCITVPLNFIINKFWTFANKPEE